MSTTSDPARSKRMERRSLWKLWGGSILVTIVLFAIAWKVMGPPPPDHLVFAAGPEDGMYYRLAKAYREDLARDGIDVEIVPTAGSVENLDLLASGRADLAFVQGGVASNAQDASLCSLASVFLEPLWIFYRSDLDLLGLATLRDLRLAVGPEGSGTRALTLSLLDAIGVAATGTEEGDTRFLPLGGRAAATALLDGEVDAAFFVIAPEVPWLEDLLASPDLTVLRLPRREAYVRQYRFLDYVLLPEGVLDLRADIPRADLHVLAATAALVCRDDLHGAVAPLLIETARRVHGKGSLLAEPGRFPSPHYVDLPLADDARRYFEQGPSWLFRVFPFRLASFLDRAIILLLPLLTLLFPLLKTAPPLYRWGVRRRIYRWYRVVRDADRLAESEVSTEVAAAELEKLRTIEQEVGDVSIPLSYVAEFYQLRLHLDFVARRLEGLLKARREATSRTPGAPSRA